MTTMTNNPIMNLVLAVAASAAMLSFAAVPAEARSVEVTVSKAEFQTAEGRKAVDARLLRAARAACDSQDRSLRTATIEKQCVADAVAEARLQMASMTFGSTQLASR